MSEFLNSIKVTNEEKKKAISKIIFTVMLSSNILSLNEILSKQQRNDEFESDEEVKQLIEQKLNSNEILAAYSLARDIKISMMISSEYNKRLFEYLDLKFGSVNEDNLLKFVNEIVKDIEITKKRNPKTEWNLQIGKIFSRLEGKGPYKEEDLKDESNKLRNNNIIKFNNHLEK